MMNSQLKSVLVGLCLAGLSFAGAGTAAAQEEGGVVLEPTTTTAEGGGGDSGGREPLISGSTVEVNEGLWISAGLDYLAHSGGDAGFRIEVGLPIAELPIGTLSVYLPFSIFPERFNSDNKFHVFSILPGVRYEVSLLERYGRLSLFGSFGFGVWISHSVVAGQGDSTTYASMRFDTGATFTFPFGLYLTLVPVGVVGAMGHNGTGEGFYEYALLAGYRF